MTRQAGLKRRDKSNRRPRERGFKKLKITLMKLFQTETHNISGEKEGKGDSVLVVAYTFLGRFHSISEG